MALTNREISKLNRIVKLAEELAADGVTRSGQKNAVRRANGKTPRTRRTGRELAQFRKMLKAERRKGVPVAALAKKHGISSAYIYLLP